jgi:hypothetical protein
LAVRTDEPLYPRLSKEVIFARGTDGRTAHEGPADFQAVYGNDAVYSDA